MKLFFCSVALLALGAGCRGSDDHAGPLQTGLSSVHPAPPTALGGGPQDEVVYPASSALNVIVDASCRCNATAECRQATATRYAETLGRCAKGVSGRMLSECASHESAASCGTETESTKASSDACWAPALCEVGP